MRVIPLLKLSIKIVCFFHLLSCNPGCLENMPLLQMTWYESMSKFPLCSRLCALSFGSIVAVLGGEAAPIELLPLLQPFKAKQKGGGSKASHPSPNGSPTTAHLALSSGKRWAS